MATIDPATTKRTLGPPDRALVAETIHTRLPFPGTFKKLLPLAGDASNRRYFRIEISESGLSSVILMQLAEPEAFKQSEEAVSGATHAVAELPFINIMTHLSRAGVSVPDLYYYDQAAGLLYLEDFGDLTLSEACANARTADLEARYKQAIDVLVGMQCLLSRGIDDVIGRRHDIADGADRRLVVHGPTKRNNLCHAFPLPYWIESLPAVRSHRVAYDRRTPHARRAGHTVMAGR